MALPNKDNVRTYYARNKKVVAFRKAMKRCRECGSVPTLRSMLENDIPLTALLVAFGDWAGNTGDQHKIHRQHRKLDIVKHGMDPTRKTDFTVPASHEAKALVYMRRFSHASHADVGLARRWAEPL